MNRIFIVVMLCLMGGIFNTKVQAQDVRIDDANNQVESLDRLTFEFTYADFLNKPEGMKTKWYNRGVNVYYNYNIYIDKNKHVAFSPGLGISSQNVYSNSRHYLADNDSTAFAVIDGNLSYRNNKLALTYLEAPMELRFSSNADKMNRKFKFALGIRLGYLMNIHSKYRGDEYDASNSLVVVKEKDARIPNVSKVRFSPSVRIGYGSVNLVASYAMPLFDQDKGPQMNLLMIGVSFNTF
ncbi:MAG: outer membrane beta-barrel protein [Chitinophagales bacterium]|nr:PorT family protein [Bacteroidota bacterium]MCB9044378.1 PorT family protein [Chitinophagales bacterium]